MTHELERDLVAVCLEAARAMSVYAEVIGQKKARGSGTTQGAPDMILYAAGHAIPIEFKRARNYDGTPAGTLSLAQIVAMERRADQGVRTHVVTSLEEFVGVVNKARSRH